MDSELGYAFAIAGCALLLDALLPFVSYYVILALAFLGTALTMAFGFGLLPL
jgi:hypothetical protein